MITMRNIWIMMLGICLFGCGAGKQPPSSQLSLTWKLEKDSVEARYFKNTFCLTNNGNKSLADNWVIYFNQTPIYYQQPINAPLEIECIGSTYYKMYPTEHYQALAPGETLSFTILSEGNVINVSSVPEGAYIVATDEKGKMLQPQNIPIEIGLFTPDAQWIRSKNSFPYADGNYLYKQNDDFSKPVDCDILSLFPTPKKVEKTGGVSTFSPKLGLKFDGVFKEEALLLKKQLTSQLGCTVSDKDEETIIELKKTELPATCQCPDEYYEIVIKNNLLTLKANDAHGIFNACQTLVALLDNMKLASSPLPNLHITDYPDMGHRGIMLDVARNFTKKTDLLKLIDILSFYKMNVLHLHLSDDEAWRVEIPGLEELTEIASRRGHTTDELTCLYPAYAWGWNEVDTTSLANGYYSRSDFMDILKYAKERHIRIIPEIDIPGHSRAAIKAMNARYRKYIDTDQSKAEEYLLIDFADTSQYLSAQNFTDNVINVAMPSTYRFLEKVIDEIGRMYQDAGVELPAFHVGGDEVPEGIWEGSSICRTFMKEHGLAKIRDLKDYFLEQILEMLDKRNIQAVGWQDIVMKPDNTVNEHFRNSKVLNYCWNTIPEQGGDEVPYKLANAGYPIILCNVGNFYLDMAYCYHVEEPGLRWGGYVDEYVTFDMLPFDIYKSLRRNLKGESVDVKTASNGKQPLTKEGYKNIKGLSGQIWAETIRSFEQIEYYLFPKVFGLAERAWNAQPSWALSPDSKVYADAKRKYNAGIVTYELPRLAKRGINFRVSPPGIIVKDGLLFVNATNPNAVIRYTTDGSEPTENSVKWQTPIACDAPQIKAKAFYLGKESVTTVLINE
ncbi:beta-N-acetylglucosaminidase [Bacteroides ovatus]|uniref:family 20 glycosylhydrolase n=1 Tax=Bacteroides TaxID=816 RepID=UPI000E87B08D|nr:MULTISPECIES: family 20 glycosylhydrolase [Bacteroides]MCS3174973.1 carbohydate-binding domain-containing protein [Candidatus Bacteroides intestinigallinarum]RGN63567.1 beta-N-acetylglucosaminidase [Bacteroides sp. OM05-10AA]RGQ67177.1 beta-N-acetylglucosaminidase [Bacteroides sp. AF27-33]CAG9896931.1 beta-N-acetylglucosaminidase [Bacteroides ovatus]